jgi:hypothetical protein
LVAAGTVSVGTSVITGRLVLVGIKAGCVADGMGSAVDDGVAVFGPHAVKRRSAAMIIGIITRFILLPPLTSFFTPHVDLIIIIVSSDYRLT